VPVTCRTVDGGVSCAAFDRQTRIRAWPTTKEAVGPLAGGAGRAGSLAGWPGWSESEFACLSACEWTVPRWGAPVVRWELAETCREAEWLVKADGSEWTVVAVYDGRRARTRIRVARSLRLAEGARPVPLAQAG
jgi:hypothetical protein